MNKGIRNMVETVFYRVLAIRNRIVNKIANAMAEHEPEAVEATAEEAEAFFRDYYGC